MNATLPRCPACGSIQVFIQVRPMVAPRSEGHALRWVNGKAFCCRRCFHVWGRQASRVIEVQVDQPRPPFWRRVLHVLAALITRNKEIR